MLRTHTCAELKIDNAGLDVTLTGWAAKVRDLGGMTFIDLRDRYGITQLVFNMDTNAELCTKARQVGREFVLKVAGKVAERTSKNPDMVTGDIEVIVEDFDVLNASKVPPFTIEDDTDGGEEIRMKYRYLDLRREPIKQNLLLRHKVLQETRKYLSDQGFLEIETPFLIKSTPEGARDFVVPSRVNEGQFYALPQSPQTFKQLFMVAGFDKYFQIVRCFRDEDLRADRQPEFTQIDCEMSFVEQQDVLEAFEGLVSHLYKAIKNIELQPFKVLSYDEALTKYGTDKPDLRFEMEFVYLTEAIKGTDFKVFGEAEMVVGINAIGCATYSRKQLDALTDFVKTPQVGAKGMVYVKYNEDGTFKSSVDKFFTEADFKKWAEKLNANPGDLILIIAGEKSVSLRALSELRLKMADMMELKDPKKVVPLFVTDFPLFMKDEESGGWLSTHHPFTSPKEEDIDKLDSDPGSVSSNAYDIVINGIELASGSIRIHKRELQEKVFSVLGLSKEEAAEKFGFLMDAFEYGAPPHGGIAFGFDRIVALFGGTESIREYIAFPKNNMGKDVMLDAPAAISNEQLDELKLQIKK